MTRFLFLNLFFLCLFSSRACQAQDVTIRVASISFEPVKFQLRENADKLEKWFREAAAGEAKIAVAPEGALDGYVVNEIIAGSADADRIREVALSIDSPTIRRFRELARELKLCLVFGFAEKINNDVFNTAIFIDNKGTICGTYHKMQFHEGYDESWWFNRLGKRSRAFDTPYGRCGVLICNDRWNPLLAKIPALDGAQFLVIPAFGSTSKSQDEAVLARGVETGLPVIEANVGVSLIVDANHVVAVKRQREGLTFGQITISDRKPIDRAERDRVESEFLQWRAEEMPLRLAKRREALASLRNSDTTLRLATFRADATPPLGSPLCNGNVTPVMEIVTPLSARGVVLLGAGDPIVLCAFDWVGIGNGSYDAFRKAIAEAVGTTEERVALHTLHQHDAPGSDFATERLLTEHGLDRKYSNADFDAQVMTRVANAARNCLPQAKPVTHIGLGSGRVEKVASNRRILGPDGRVALQRQSSGAKNPEARDAPEGTIDPLVRLVAFWNEDQPLAVMTYYATHPQSYYGRGSVNWDFVGIAREMRETALSGLPHVHFDGAGGNVAAGKYNDGSKETRPILAQRLADGMTLAWESQTKSPISSADVNWSIEPVSLPIRDTLDAAALLSKVGDVKQTTRDRLRAARDLTFVRRMQEGHRIPLTCLQLGQAWILHMPGELFVEYQLAAQQLRPNAFVAMAAYGDYGPGYIGTEIAYEQGGYETGKVSRVAPQVEKVLMDALRTLLKVEP